MECPSCLEIYDDRDRIPRNLPCGHTYCEYCISQILIRKSECPTCRHKFDPTLKASSFSKNFVALEVSSKHREIQKKLLFCTNHQEPLRFFCETCQVNICASCIIDHSGHKFTKQDHSVPLLKQRANDLKTKIVKKLDDVKNVKTVNEGCRQDIIKTQSQQLQYIDEEFDRIIAKVMMRKEALKASYQDSCQDEINALEKEIGRTTASIQDIGKNVEIIDKYIEKLDKLKLVQGDQLNQEISDIEDSLNKYQSINAKNLTYTTALLPHVIFDPSLHKEIKSIGITSKDLRNTRICYFGEKNKILIYYVETDEWVLTQLPLGEIYEFNYYSSAVTLPNGTIFITGGGISNAVYQVHFNAYHPNRLQQVRIAPKAPMHQSRKEHASVFLQDSVYVLGGYDGMMNTFLNSCERYDVESNTWIPVCNMLIPKCAFGATTLSNRYIFTLGGYDGNDRLSSIERYDIKADKWTLLEVELKQSLSNSACYAYSDNSIVILGGGYNNGFCLEVNHLDVNAGKWKELPSMSDGRDLRNKLVSINGSVYAIGGNNCVAEKYSVKKGVWQYISSYKDFVDDNLDSWSCALYYDVHKKTEELPNTSMLNTGVKVPRQQAYNGYQYDERYEEEIFSEGSSNDDDWI